MPGYEVKFVNPLLKRHECPICHFAMKNPLQIECGHIFCRDCLYSTLDQKQPSCPVDMDEIRIDNIFHDNAVRREILSLEVYCQFKSGGCCWSGTLNSLEDHLSKCEHREVQCSWCGQNMQNQNLRAHQDSECPRRLESQTDGDSDTSHNRDLVQQEQSRHEDESQSQRSTEITAPVQESEQRVLHSILSCFAPIRVYGNQILSRIYTIEKKQAQQKAHMGRLEASMASTYNGSFMWRIPDLSKRKRDAIDGRVTSLYSPPFYTAKNGYKMCIRIYLNGDGMGHKTHLSLFFVLMKGEFDSLLKWPFDNKVSLILVNQNHHKHIMQTFIPTPESSSFQRPITDMNVASGYPQFCKLSFLDDENYTKDDVLFVKCIVDTSRIFHP